MGEWFWFNGSAKLQPNLQQTRNAQRWCATSSNQSFWANLPVSISIITEVEECVCSCVWETNYVSSLVIQTSSSRFSRLAFPKRFPNLSILLNMFMLYFTYEMRTTDVVKVERIRGRRSKNTCILNPEEKCCKRLVWIGCYFVYVWRWGDRLPLRCLEVSRLSSWKSYRGGCLCLAIV